MNVDDFFIILTAIAAVVSSATNLAYYFTHSNGKKYVRLFSGISMLYVISIAIQRFFHLRTVTMSEVWPFLPLLLLFPAADAWVDWNKNKLPIDKRLDERMAKYAISERRQKRRREEDIILTSAIAKVAESEKRIKEAK